MKSRVVEKKTCSMVPAWSCVCGGTLEDGVLYVIRLLEFY